MYFYSTQNLVAMEFQAQEKSKRRSYTREKLHVIKWYLDNDQNKASNAVHFQVDRKRVREWVQNEELIRATKLTTRKNKSGRLAMYPIAEQKLHKDFKRFRGEGKSVKRYCFNQRMRQLIRQHYHDSIEEFRNSDQWFARFCRRFKVSLRRETHTAQKVPAELEFILRKFHKHLLRVRKRGKYELADIANMGQTGLSFITDDGKTYETTNSKMSGVSQVNQALTSDNAPCNSPLFFVDSDYLLKTAKRSNGIKELLFNFKRMLGVMKQLWLLGYRTTGAAILEIHQCQVPMASYLLQIFIEAKR